MSGKPMHALLAVLLPTEVVPTDLMVFTAKISDEYPAVNSLLSSAHHRSRIRGRDGEYIVGGYGSANALEFIFAHRLDLDGVLDSHQYARADEYLSRLGFVAQPGCNIGHRPDGGIIEPPFETDGAERRKTVGDTDAKPNVVTKPPPFLRKRSDDVPHFERHQHRLERWLLDWHWIVKHHHHAVAGVALKLWRALRTALY